jgi:hypothetical protein
MQRSRLSSSGAVRRGEEMIGRGEERRSDSLSHSKCTING